MARKFSLITKEFQDYVTDLIGISKDNWIDEQFVGNNNGGDTYLHVRNTVSPFFYRFIVIEIVMPNEEDIIGFDILEEVKLALYCRAFVNTFTQVVGIIEIPDDWTEGVGSPITGASNWDEAKIAVPWKAGSGAIKSRDGTLDDSEQVLDTVQLVYNAPLNTWVEWDLTRALDLGNKKTFVLFTATSTGAQEHSFGSREWASTTLRPKLIVSYRSYPPEGFTDDADKLRIEPNPDNPEQPKLIWGSVEASDFSQYKIYRDTNPITSVESFKSAITVVNTSLDYFEIDGDYRSAFPVGSTFKITGSTGNDGRWTVLAVSLQAGDTRIEVVEDVTDATVDGYVHHGIWTSIDPAVENFIDADSLTENTIYYYRLIAEDQDNHEDFALKSATVSFKRPDNTFTEPTENVDVGELVDVTLNSSILCKRAYIEWGDSIDGYWIEVEQETTSFTLYHRYSETGAKVIKARLESSDGFWSDLKTVATKTVDDLNPDAILVCRPLVVVSGEAVRCIGARSQPKASNATITQYDYFVNGSWQNDKGPVFEVVPTSTQEIRLRVTTSTSKVTTQGVGEGEDITVISGDPTDLVFSRSTAISTRQESRDSEAEIAGIYDGIGEIDLPFGITNPNYDITGMSDKDDFKADIDLIRAFHEAQTYARITGMDEAEGVTVQLDGRIAGYQITQVAKTFVTWRLTFRVFNRTEV